MTQTGAGDTSEDNGHPVGWTQASLNDLVYIAARIGWRGLKAEEYTSSGPLFLSVHSLNKGEHVDYTTANHISWERYLESPEIKLQENDILLTKDGAGIGKLGIVVGLPGEATINSSLLLIRSLKAFIPRFLFYTLSGWKMQELVQSRITGSATPHLFQRDIKKFQIAVPPLAEQQRIVAKVEELLARVHAARQRLARVPAILKRFRQSVLAAACSGRLTVKWREKNRGHDVPFLPLSGSELAVQTDGVDLPEMWAWTTISVVANRVTDGTHLPPPLAETGVPFVLIGNVDKGKIDWNGIRKWVSEETFKMLTARCRPEKGDVLYTAVGATFGQALEVVGMLPKKWSKCYESL